MKEYTIFEISRQYDIPGQVKLRAQMRFPHRAMVTVQTYCSDQIEIGKVLEIMEQQLSRAVGDALVKQ